MPREVVLLKVGMTMTEGMISEWYVKDGAEINTGDMVYALETEKVSMDVDADASGILRHRIITGETLAPGEVIGFIFESGEAMPEDISVIPVVRKELEPVEAGEESTVPDVSPSPIPASSVSAERTVSSPAARKVAAELGVDLAKINGTGPRGRIIKEDVLMIAQAETNGDVSRRVKASPIARRLASERGIDLKVVKASGPGGRIVEADLAVARASGELLDRLPPIVDSIPITSMRRTIGQRMYSSLQQSAQLTMDMTVDMGDAVKLRQQLIGEWQEEGIRPTYTDLIIKAVVKALRKHPLMNSTLNENEIVLFNEYHIGLAVSLDNGLVVPVLRNTELLSVKQISDGSAQLASAARSGRLSMDDYAGATFTISSLGMYGVDSFTPIINAPQAGILGVNRIYEGVAWEDDRPVKTQQMNLSLTWDHRILDCAPAAAFLGEVCTQLQEPYRLLI